MARIRTIKPTFFRSQEMADLPLSARLTYIGLWTYVDDAGKGLDDARLVKGDLWQLDERHTTKKVEADLALLAERGHIERYEVGGRRYLRVVSWSKHQKINRPSKSTFPDPLTDDSLNGHGANTEDSPGEGKGREWNKEKGSDSAPSERGVAGLSASSDARTTPPLDAPSGASGLSTAHEPEQVERNRAGIGAARSALRSAS